MIIWRCVPKQRVFQASPGRLQLDALVKLSDGLRNYELHSVPLGIVYSSLRSYALM